MMDFLTPSRLDATGIARCQDTMSAYTFYLLVGNALLRQEELSVVRMADGEHMLFAWCNAGQRFLSDSWMRTQGLAEISKGELLHRMMVALEECTYYAPSLCGIYSPDYDVYPVIPRKHYVDFFFNHVWSEELKTQLFETAKHVLFIHRSAKMAEKMRKNAAHLGVKVTHLLLSDWRETEGVVERAKAVDAPLVLFSGGPASKLIGPAIAHAGNKVALDVGAAANLWTLSNLVGKA
jgi:hypothetical protein